MFLSNSISFLKTNIVKTDPLNLNFKEKIKAYLFKSEVQN